MGQTKWFCRRPAESSRLGAADLDRLAHGVKQETVPSLSHYCFVPEYVGVEHAQASPSLACIVYPAKGRWPLTMQPCLMATDVLLPILLE